MKIIGLTGGIGSGKSEVSKILAQYNGYIIDADKLNHEIMLKGNLAYNEITNLFGTSILKEDGEIDRKKLGEIVFSHKEKLGELIGINHKYVIQETHRQIEELQKNPLEYKFIVIDAPLLIEAGLHKTCDIVYVLKSDLETRIARIIKRDGITKQQARNRINNQMSFEEMVQYANYIITNNQGKSELAKEVLELLRRL